jgi:UDP-GlcNAc:undecaprenyl-phosphate GlcNAc-1-phosphate transferase
MRTVLVLAFLTSFLVSLVLTAAVRRVAARLGFVDRPGGRRQHAAPTPKGGGVAIVLASCLLILGSAAAAYLWERDPSALPLLAELHADVVRAAETLPLILYVLGGGLALAFFGLWDDLRPMRPLQKLAIQVVIATVIVITSGMRISAFIPADWIQVLITVLWIVVLTNSFNLLDNMDGLSGTMAFICGGALLILALQTMQFFVAGFVLALMGAVLGFLFFNFPPATIFMGDMGSMFIGYMLATATVLTTFVNGGRMNPLFPLLVPLIIFAVPLYDTVSVLAIRLHHKRPVMIGDWNHFSHRLHRLGMSQRRVLLTVGLITVATSLGATIPYGTTTWRVCVPAVQAAAVVCVIMLLELVSVEIHYDEPGKADAQRGQKKQGTPPSAR